MKIKLLSFALLLSFSVACTKSSKTGDAMEDMQWLIAKKAEMAKNCTCMPSIWQETYEGKTIYETGCRGPACLCAHQFYDENGKFVPGSEESNRLVFLGKLQNRKLLWFCGSE